MNAFEDRRQAALDPATDAVILAQLVRDESLVIVGYASGHPSTRPADLVVAARGVNAAIAGTQALWHPTSSVADLMEMGTSNPIPVVQYILVNNPNAPAEALVELGASMRAPFWLLRGIAAHANCPVDLLIRLVNDDRRRAFRAFEESNVLYDALRNDRFPREMARAYVDHPSPVVANTAMETTFN